MERTVGDLKRYLTDLSDENPVAYIIFTPGDVIAECENRSLDEPSYAQIKDVLAHMNACATAEFPPDNDSLMEAVFQVMEKPSFA